MLKIISGYQIRMHDLMVNLCNYFFPKENRIQIIPSVAGILRFII